MKAAQIVAEPWKITDGWKVFSAHANGDVKERLQESRIVLEQFQLPVSGHVVSCPLLSGQRNLIELVQFDVPRDH